MLPFTPRQLVAAPSVLQGFGRRWILGLSDNEDIPFSQRWRVCFIFCLVPIAFSFFAMGILLAVWSFVAGWWIYVITDSPACKQLSTWLFWYLTCLGTLPCGTIFTAPLVLWQSYRGLQLCDQYQQCQEKDPYFCGYVLQSWIFNLVTGALWWVALFIGALAVSLRHHVQRHFRGSAVPRASVDTNTIEVVAAVDVPEGTQCAVCIEFGELDSQWRRLVCGHYFHDRCIVPWFQRNRFCPLCRHDVTAAQQDTTGTELAVRSPT